MKYDRIVRLPSCNSSGEVNGEPDTYLLSHAVIAVAPEGSRGTYSCVLSSGFKVFVPLSTDEIAKRLGWTEDSE